MNKLFVALAVFAVAVFAKSYQYTPPELPCSYEVKMKFKNEKDSSYLGKFTVFGQFLRLKIEDDNADVYMVYRPDITEEGNKKKIGAAMVTKTDDDEFCNLTTYVELATVEKTLKSIPDALFSTIESLTWQHKEDVEYDGDECTVYYDDDVEKFALYICDDYPVLFHAIDDKGADQNITYEWDFKISLKDFRLKACDGDYAETPDEKYVVCPTYDSSANPSGSESGKESGSESGKESEGASTVKAVALLVFAVIVACLF
jgi:hypothetical protein